MIRRVSSAATAVLLMAVVLGSVPGCDSLTQRDGFGTLTVSTLGNPPQPGHFTVAPVPVVATLRAQRNGCLTVTVDGVTRVPLWPDGTNAQDDGDRPGSYSVSIPGGATLRASEDSGDVFAALGVVDDGGPRFAPEGEPDDGMIASYLGFCDVDAAPIAFFDANSIKTR